MIHIDNFWFRTCPTRFNVTATIPSNIDVLIIGGGIAGTMLLYQLINSGITNILLIEEATIGFHASGRSSGQLMLRGASLFHKMQNGEQYLKFIYDNNQQFISLLRDAYFESDFIESGGLRLALNQNELDDLIAEAEFLNKYLKINCPLLDQSDIQQLLPDTNFIGGIFIPIESIFNPYKIVNGIREWIERDSFKILTNSKVESVVRNPNGTFNVSVFHKGTIKAKNVIYCTNSYTKELVPQLSNVIRPFRGQMIVTDILPDNILSNIPIMSMTCNDCREYFRLYANRLLVGGMRSSIKGHQLDITNDSEISQTIYENLRRFIIQSFSALKNIKFEQTWSGIMCTTPDSLPLIGNLGTNEFIMAGFNGYGFGHVVGGSQIIKDLLLTGKADNQLFDPVRFIDV